MVFHWSLRDNKSPQVSRTLLSILADLNNVVIWRILARPSISNSFSSFTKPLGIVPSAPITIGITVTLMFHSFFGSLVRSKYLCLFLFSLIFTLWLTGMAKFTIPQVLFFLLTITRSSLLAEVVWSNFNFSHNCLWIKPSSPSHVESCTLFVLDCCICLLGDLSFLYPHITYTYYSVVYD